MTGRHVPIKIGMDSNICTGSTPVPGTLFETKALTISAFFVLVWLIVWLRFSPFTEEYAFATIY
jgi:hypothetical protein